MSWYNLWESCRNLAKELFPLSVKSINAIVLQLGIGWNAAAWELMQSLCSFRITTRPNAIEVHSSIGRKFANFAISVCPYMQCFMQ
jgi:hypothetical protein